MYFLLAIHLLKDELEGVIAFLLLFPFQVRQSIAFHSSRWTEIQYMYSIVNSTSVNKLQEMKEMKME